MTVTLPDGRELELDEGATGADAAAAIGAGLARAALAVKVNGDEVRDLARPLADGDRIDIITPKSDGALDLIRHDTAHVLAAAALELYPGVKISIGPPIEHGFYYDFEFPDGVTISDADFERIEQKMREHVKADEEFVREDVGVDEALARFRAEDQPYKVELIEDLIANTGTTTVSLYTNGPFTDLCRGPHAPSTKRIKAFKLQSVAGAYWRGDADRQQLTRIYGTAFFSKEDLDQHLERLEQARARDHRRLGPQLGLFQFSDVAQGAAFWLPKGTSVFNSLVGLSRDMADTTATRGQDPAAVRQRAVADLGALVQVPRQHVRDLVGGPRARAQADELPRACQLFKLQRWSHRDLRSATPSPASCTQRAQRRAARPAARPPLRADDAHIFCTPDQTSRRSRAA
jgi:threonyl-tRNA synthetase